MCKKLIELEKINKNYGSLRVLKDVFLYLSKGEIVSIVGPSGSGKTTILNIIARLILPDKGKVRIAKDKRIGYVFQEPRLIPWKNVENNILFAQKNYSLQEDVARKLREKLIHKTGMENFVHYFPSQLSGGMKQRVALIRALSIMSHILLLDEPFKSIDNETASVIEKIILEIWEEENQGILMVTHDYKKAIRLSNRVYFLSQRSARLVKESQKFLPESPELSLPQSDYHRNSFNQEFSKKESFIRLKNNFRRK